MDKLTAVLTALGSWSNKPGVRTAEHLLAIGALYLLAKKLRKLKLTQLLSIVPGAKEMVDKQIEKEARSAVADMFPSELDAKMVTRLPAEGIAAGKILTDLASLKKYNADAHEGKLFAYVYDTDDTEFHRLVEKAFALYLHDNGLNPMNFPALRKLEVDVVRMTINMLNGPESAVGTVTTGGAHYFGLKLVYVPLARDFRVDVQAVRKAITKNTILICCSAPQFPHGVIDPVVELAAIAEEHKLPLHVDACIGGFVLPWIEKLGYKLPLWDFRVRGVTSISADVHKYGYAAKGASVLAFRNASDRRFQFFAFTEWPGGLFVSPSITGTRNGGCIAGAWAAMMGLGESGYMRLTKMIMDTKEKLVKGINRIPGLEILGSPHSTLIAIRSTDSKVNILAVADVMQEGFGWKMERQQKPDSIHFTLMPVHHKVADDLLKHLAASVEKVRADPSLNSTGSAAMYGMLAKLPDNMIVENFLTSFVGKVYNGPEPVSESAV